MALVSYGSSDESSSSDVEDEQTPKERVVREAKNEEKPTPNKTKSDSQSSKKNFRNQIKSDLLKSISLTKNRDSTKSVSIAMPILDEYGEEDVVEDEPKRKRVKASSTSGLFAILPPPKNATLNAKETKRQLIPHSVSKKNEAKMLKIEKLNKYLKPDVELTIPETKDTEIIDFFSLQDREPLTLSAPKNIIPEVKPVASSDYNADSDDDHTNQYSYDVSGPSNQSVDDGACYSENNYDNNLVYPQLENQAGSLELTQENPETSESQSSDPYQDDQFWKLMGKKKGEQIDFIEISEEDHKADREEWQQKALSEEKSAFASAKQLHNPGGVSKRKHQITYLAFQAKQRELELKNAWAQSRQTRKQTQAKYGF